MSVDGAKTQEWAVTTLALANGRYQGGGMLIAPRARMNDGRMDITVVERITLREAAPQLHLLYTGGVYGHPKAHHLRAARVRLDADGEVPLEIDGEAVGTLPLEAEVAPAVVRLVCPAGASL
jgi:diacylglycerol kinase (ATP)